MLESSTSRQTQLPGYRGGPALILVLAILAANTAFGAATHNPAAFANATQFMLRPGDIVYADSGNAMEGGFIIKVDPASGEKTVISSGGLLDMPFDVAIDENGDIIASDRNRLIRIDPETGGQTVLADNEDGRLGSACGLALDRRGDVLVANLQNIVKVDAVTGQIQLAASGGNLLYPLGVAADAAGELFVLNIAFPHEIIRVHPQAGRQTVISRGGFLINPQGIAVSGGYLYITDVATSDGNFGVGRVLRVDSKTGVQTIVAQGGYLVGPVGISVDADGQLIVGDPYTINLESPDLYDGGIVRINPATGEQTLLACGGGSVVNPRGVAVCPNLERTPKR